MAKQQFINWTPRGEASALVTTITAICEDYARQGYDLTLRQLYYQLVARDLISNDFRSYKRIGSIVDSARLAGLLDWKYIVDRTRNVYTGDGFDDSPEATLRAAANTYSRTFWEDQPNHVEVWVEKEALSGVIERAARETKVHYFSCRGYVSQSEMYAAGRRFWRMGQILGKPSTIIHLGDHDPSGIDMTRDIIDRLTMFSEGHTPDVRRIALNMDQVEAYSPPPNFAKTTDARYAGYQALYGEDSWELDALDLVVLHDLIVAEVATLRDDVIWAATEERDNRERDQLARVVDSWQEVQDFLDANED